ncbi:MAG: hypothetical protein AABX95_04375 [Nanoarchaeota archaeon]
MEKDIDRIPKNQDTDIVIRIDDFGGRSGLTIREFVRSERYIGFTKAGTRIAAEHFRSFKEAINSIKEEDFIVETIAQEKPQQPKQQTQIKEEEVQPKKEEETQTANKKKAKSENYEELEM